jgi:hypothetical protein
MRGHLSQSCVAISPEIAGSEAAQVGVMKYGFRAS